MELGLESGREWSWGLKAGSLFLKKERKQPINWRLCEYAQAMLTLLADAYFAC
jgi:hypothetical protein